MQLAFTALELRICLALVWLAGCVLPCTRTTAASLGMVQYFMWSFSDITEALTVAGVVSAPQPGSLADDELSELRIRTGTVACLSAILDVRNEAVQAANIWLRILC